MSVMSEDPPTNPQDPLHYAPRRTNPRPELRLSTVSSAVGETPFDRAPKPEPVRRVPPPPPTLSAELENAVFESLRRQMDPEVVPEPPAIEPRAWVSAWRPSPQRCSSRSYHASKPAPRLPQRRQLRHRTRR